MWWAIDLEGGSAGFLDAIDGDNLTGGDSGFVFRDNSGTYEFYPYRLENYVSDPPAEASPDTITPDANAGNKRWKLAKIFGSGAEIRGQLDLKGDGSTTAGKSCFYSVGNSTYFCINSPTTIDASFNVTWFSALPDSTRPVGVGTDGTMAPMSSLSAASVTGGTNYALALWDSNTPAVLDSLATGTAGQGLFSGGSAANPAWSETFGNGTIEPKIKISKNATTAHYSGIVMDFTCHETIALGQPVVINGDGEVALANADTPATLLPAIGIAVVGGNAAATCTILTHGSVTNTSWAWTPGGIIYVDDSGAGALTATVGDIGSGNGVQRIGIAIHADSILVMPSLTVTVLE